MKNKILTLIIGILIGAIIATAGFIIYTKVNQNNKTTNNRTMMEKSNMQGGFQEGGMQNKKGNRQITTEGNEQVNNLSNTENEEPPALPDGEMPSGEAPSGNPPSMPDGEMPSGEAPNGTPPEMPNNSNQT